MIHKLLGLIVVMVILLTVPLVAMAQDTPPDVVDVTFDVEDESGGLQAAVLALDIADVIAIGLGLLSIGGVIYLWAKLPSEERTLAGLDASMRDKLYDKRNDVAFIEPLERMFNGLLESHQNNIRDVVQGFAALTPGIPGSADSGLLAVAREVTDGVPVREKLAMDGPPAAFGVPDVDGDNLDTQPLNLDDAAPAEETPASSES